MQPDILRRQNRRTLFFLLLLFAVLTMGAMSLMLFR